jgi:hypothetical protein
MGRAPGAGEIMFRVRSQSHMKKDEFKEFYRERLAVPVAGFGMAAVMLCLFLLLMTWLSERLHHLQFCIGH